MDKLLEKIPEFSADVFLADSANDNVARMILGQFRWLDNVVDSKALTTKLLELLEGILLFIIVQSF